MKVCGRELLDIGMNLKVLWTSGMKRCEGTLGTREQEVERGQAGLLTVGFNGGGHTPGRHHVIHFSLAPTGLFASFLRELPS